MKFETVYHWNAIDKLLEGSDVMVLDKLKNRVFDLKKFRFGIVAEIVTSAKKDADRFVFYKISKEEMEVKKNECEKK